MPKAVLIMDMPENCFKCKLQNWANCRITNKCHVGECRPDWCPLRELPEKKERRIGEHGERMFRAGFNACLNEIMRQDMSDSVD
jgi:hypothetical protein